jgi:hypothetical protein
MSRQTVSPFIEFCKANREEVKAANPTANFGDMGRLLKVRWDELNETKKSAYQVKKPDTADEPGLRRSSRLRNQRLGLDFWGLKQKK